MSRTKQIRSIFALAVTVLVAVTLLLPEFSGANTTEVKRLQTELNKINDEFSRAGKAFDKAFWSLDETEKKIEDAEGRIAANEVELASDRKALEGRIGAWYRADELGMLAFVFESEDLSDLVLRLEYASRVAENDSATIRHAEEVLTQLRTDREVLAAEQQQRAKSVDKLKKERDDLQKRLKSKKAEYERVQRELAEAARRADAEAARRSAASAAPAAPVSTRSVSVAGPNGMVFPVAGPNYYSDTWGASRGGGRRRHKGTDIMAATGTPVVATMSGTVSRGDGATSGLYLRVRADNGWTFYYMHLDKITVGSGRVTAGQVIGTVGYTGNASASAPHLHYEIHPAGSGAVNPYPYLRKMQGR
ncbi:MAG: peptidoglycan DD-metalloendopeptidase family protein [Coriobacteriia bacterium]|nr:peptidoglycan DD-metalloendopeptidase family protein [Coriobacteriia bacterium]